MEFLAWYNLVFEIPFFFSLVYLLLMSSGLLPDHDHDLDLDHDVDVHVVHVLHVDHDIHADHHVEHERDWDIAARLLSVLGIGKVPVSLIAMTFALIWSFLGFAVNTLLQPALPVFLFFSIAVAVATVGSFSLTGIFSRLVARILPTNESYDSPEAGLIGEVAEVVYLIDAKGGTARVRDAAGNLQDVQCVLQQGIPTVPRGVKVLLADYNTDQRTFVVVPAEWPGSLSGSSAQPLSSENPVHE